MANTIGAAVKSARKKRGLTRRELAVKCGCQEAAIGHIERGIRKPSPRMAETLRRELGIPLDKLLPGLAKIFQSAADERVPA